MKTTVVDIHKKNGKRPEFDVYIGRITARTEFIKDSKWANPRLTLEEYELYIKHMMADVPEYFDLEELRGKRLGCWCITTNKIKPLKCHGQILLKLIREREK